MFVESPCSATGPGTEIGAIGTALAQTAVEATPLQRELDRVGRLLGGAVIAIANRAEIPDEYIGVLLLAVSLAVAAVPEGLTAITTVVLSRSACAEWRGVTSSFANSPPSGRSARR